MDWHGILGININSTIDEVKSAYRKKALEFHPDRYKGKDAAEKFQQVNDAYRALSDPNFKPINRPPKPQYKPKPAKPVRSRQRWYNDYEPEGEVDLWAQSNYIDPMTAYWKEYERLKKEMVYEDPELFWKRLDEWSAQNIRAGRP